MAIGPKSQRDQVLVAVAMIALLLVGAYWMYAYSPKQETLATLASRVDSLDQHNRKARQELAHGNTKNMRAETEQMEKSLTVMRQLVPQSNEVPALLEQVSTAARRAGLDLAAVEPEPVIEGEVFDTYRYRITVIGSYHSLGEFLTNVGSLTRIIAPINVALNLTASQDASASKGKTTQSLDAKFEIQTYVARSAGATHTRSAPEKKS